MKGGQRAYGVSQSTEAFTVEEVILAIDIPDAQIGDIMVVSYGTEVTDDNAAALITVGLRAGGLGGTGLGRNQRIHQHATAGELMQVGYTVVLIVGGAGESEADWRTLVLTATASAGTGTISQTSFNVLHLAIADHVRRGTFSEESAVAPLGQGGSGALEQRGPFAPPVP